MLKRRREVYKQVSNFIKMQEAFLKNSSLNIPEMLRQS
jgi:hypothetical protein